LGFVWVVDFVLQLNSDMQRNPVLAYVLEEEFRPNSLKPVTNKQGGSDMGDKGSKDKGKKEKQKVAQHTPKEKRKLKREKKQK
jgi:hypothetical protein